MQVALGFEIELDDRAREWVRRHPDERRLVIGYYERRCCGGGKVCDVSVRAEKRSERHELVRVGSVEGRELLLDRRIANRLPRRLPLTVRGIGPLRGLSLALEGEDWAQLLYA